MSIKNRGYRNYRNDDFCDDDSLDHKCCEEPCVEERDGEVVCVNCGLIHGREVIGVEKRAYTAQEVENRKRTETRWRDFGPRTLLPNTKKDSKGHTFEKKQRILFKRLSKIQNSLVSSIERNFWEAKPKMKMVSSKLNLPDHIRETAWRIYSEAVQKRLTQGRTIDGFVGASLYAAIRIHEFPRLMDDICDVSSFARDKIVQSLSLILKEVLPEMGLKYKPITSEQLIYRFGNQINLPIEIQSRANDILRNAFKNGASRVGKNPKGFAASALYIAAKHTKYQKTQEEIADAAKITEVTLRSRNKDIKKAINRVER